MSQYSLSTADPLKRGSREQARKIRLPWRADNGARKQRRYDGGEPSLIFDAGSIDTKSSRADSKAIMWPRRRTRDVSHDGKTPTQDQFRATVLGGVIFDSPPVSRAGTADGTGIMRARLSGDHHVYSDASPLKTPALSSSRSQRDWKIPSPLSVWARVPRGPADAGCEAQPPPVTPTTSTPSALTRVFGVLSRAMNR